MNNNKLLNIANKFDIPGEPKTIKLIDSGHINKTYLVTYDIGNQYILQYVNTKVFPNINELMNNIENVTNFIRKNDEAITIKFIKTKGESPSLIYNNNWRMEDFITNTKSYLTTSDLNILYKSGKSVGRFQKQLHGFKADELFEIIPKFHYTPNRVKQLKTAIDSLENKEQRKERYELAKCCLDFVLDEERLNKTNEIVDKLENKEIPLRVTHNDTKLSNVLFDKDTDEDVCLIDLDTVMPGAIAYDFGEGIRMGVTESKEDEENLSKIYVDINRFEAFTKGFLEELKGTITNSELDTLYLGAWMMTYENSIRFLADYLNGDVYYAIDPNIKNHNLIRTKAQLEILRQMEEKEDEMKGLIKQYGL